MKKLNNFGDLPEENSQFDSAKIVIVPVPYDGTSTWIKGADKGPQAIIEASANVELYDMETDSEVYKQGIYTDKFITEKSSPEKVAEKVEKTVSGYFEKNKFPVLIGGEHSVSIGAIKAGAKKFKNLTVLQLDAHSDMRDEYEGSKYNHACVMARAKEMANVVQVGIRSMDVSEKKNINPENFFPAEKIKSDETWQEKAIAKIGRKVYITIDLDVFDPSVMPSTGTPEPGGMNWYEILEFLKKVIAKKEVIGMDVVELCPNSRRKSPDFFAAKLIYKLLSYKFTKNK